MNRRDFLKATGAAALTAAMPAGCRTPDSRRYNLLFVMADQWRFSALGSELGNALATPNIDRLASQGLRCTRAYVANPICAPSRASILTGRLPHQHGVIANQLTLPPSERGFAQSFAKAGYRTHYVGKWHLNGEATPGFVPAGWRRRGFETFEGFNRGHRYNRPQTYTNEGELVHPEEFEPSYQTDRAIEFVTKPREEPFFCFLSWGPPHPRTSGVWPNQRFAARNPPWRKNVPGGMRRRSKLDQQIGEYLDLCEGLDEELGRLLHAVDDAGLLEDTVVVFTSDHGDMLGSHGLMFKEHPYEEAIRVPLIVRQPGGIRAGGESAGLVSNIDLMPTLTRLCGLDAPASCTGRDLSPAWQGRAADGVASVYCEGRTDGKDTPRRQIGKGAWRAVVTPRHKLVVDASGAVVLLTNLEEDPFELENLAERAEHRGLAATLREELDDWKRRTGDPFPRLPAAAQVHYDDPLESV